MALGSDRLQTLSLPSSITPKCLEQSHHSLSKSVKGQTAYCKQKTCVGNSVRKSALSQALSSMHMAKLTVVIFVTSCEEVRMRKEKSWATYIKALHYMAGKIEVFSKVRLAKYALRHKAIPKHLKDHGSQGRCGWFVVVAEAQTYACHFHSRSSGWVFSTQEKWSTNQ